MIELNNLSKIGFGCHHVNKNNQEHISALKFAIEKGCNLIDTSSNYNGGESEKLVGKVINISNKAKSFVMTKGGSLSINDTFLTGVNKDRFTNKEIVQISDNSFHCIHPDFLKSQIQISQNRLFKNCIDGYFLHNPEFYLLNEKNADSAIYYKRIKTAFEFLEDQVKVGNIRYYGISESTGITNFNKLVKIANEISSTNHFKLMQYPFNIVNHFVKDIKEEGLPYLDILKKSGIISFGNRPLTIRENGKTFKLIKYNHAVSEEDVLNAMDMVFSIIEEKIEAKKLGIDLTDIHIIKYIYLNWQNFDNDSFFSRLYESHFITYANDLFDQKMSNQTKEILNDFKTVLIQFIQNKIYIETKAFLTSKGLEDILKNDTIPYHLCKSYLSQGVNHVLLGMRKKKYVEDVSSLF